jgi:trimeric autotransporter adhesin
MQRALRQRIGALTLLVCALLIPLSASAIDYTVTTVAGAGTSACSTTPTLGSLISVSGPWAITADGQGNIYYVDRNRYSVCKIDSNGYVTRVAGTGVSGLGADNIQATSSALIDPINIAADPAGNLFIVDYSGCACVRKVQTNGIITTIYNTSHSTVLNAENQLATNATSPNPLGIAVSPSGEVHIAVWTSYKIFKIDSSGYVRHVAGTGTSGNSGDGGPATSANINQVPGMAFDSLGNLYLALYANVVRKIDSSTGNISTVAGTYSTNGTSGDGGPATSALLANLWGISFDKADNMYLAQRGGNAIRMVAGSTGIISKVVGVNGTTGTTDGTTANALLSIPFGVVPASNGDLYIADYTNNRIRKVASFAVMELPTPPDISFSSIVKFGTKAAITAQGGISGKITFFANGKRIAGCISRSYSNSFSCEWKPANRGIIKVYAEVVSNAGTKYRSADLLIPVSSRTSKR